MAHKFNCDLCYADIPLADNIQKVEIGGSLVAEACITCAQKLKGGIQETVSAVAKKMMATQKEIAAPTPKPEAQTPEQLAQIAIDAGKKPAPREGPAPAGQK